MVSNIHTARRRGRDDGSVTVRQEEATEAQHRRINWWMLFSRRQYVIDHIKTPLMKAIGGLTKGASWLGMLIALIQIVRIARRYPEPTKEHTLLPHTHILIDIEKEFFKHEDNRSRDALFRAIWRMFIIQYEHDPYYQYRIDWVIEQLVKRGWGIRSMVFPTKCWREE